MKERNKSAKTYFCNINIFEKKKLQIQISLVQMSFKLFYYHKSSYLNFLYVS